MSGWEWGSQLPSKVFEVAAEVEVINDELQCGLLTLHLSHQRAVLCFFNQPWTCPSTLLVGAKMLVNAWLVDRGGQVPYLAATVWVGGAKGVTANLLARIFCEAKEEEDVNMFKQNIVPLFNQLKGSSVKRSSFGDEWGEAKRARLEQDSQPKVRDNRNFSWKETNQDNSEDNQLYVAGSEVLANQKMEKEEFVCSVEGCGFKTFVVQKYRKEKIIRHAMSFHLPLSEFVPCVRREENKSRHFCIVQGCDFEFLKQRKVDILNHFRISHSEKVMTLLKKYQRQYYEENFFDFTCQKGNGGDLESTGEEHEKSESANVEEVDTRYAVRKDGHSATVPQLVGRVLKILNDDFGVGVVVLRGQLVHVLFDIHDLLINNEVCANAGKTLKEVLNVGDSIKVASVEALNVPTEQGAIWNFKLIASSVLAASSKEDVKTKKFPPGKTIVSINQMFPEKIQNFLKVVSHVTARVDLTVQEKNIFEEFKNSFPWWCVTDLPISQRFLIGHHGIIVDSIFHKNKHSIQTYVLIRFFLKVMNSKERREENKEMLAVCKKDDKETTILPGSLVTFNAVFKGQVGGVLGEDPISYFASSCRFGASHAQDSLKDSSLYTEAIEAGIKDLKKTDLYSPSMICLMNTMTQVFSQRHGLKGQKGERKSLNKALNYPMLLSDVSALLIYSSSDLAVVQVDLGMDTVFGLHLTSTKLCSSQVGFREAQQLAKSALQSGSCQVRVNCVLLDPLGSLHYIVTGLWHGKTTSLPNIEFQQLYHSVVEKFHHVRHQTIHIPQLFDFVSATKMMEKIFSTADFRRFLTQLCCQLDESAVDINQLCMTTSKGVKLTSSHVKTILQLIGDKCSTTAVREDEGACSEGGLKIMQVAVSDTLMLRVRSSGLMSMRHLGEMSQDDVYDWLVTHLELEDQQGLNFSWGALEDSQLIQMALRQGFNWNRIKEEARVAFRRKLFCDSGALNELIVGRFLRICNIWIFPYLGSSLERNNNLDCD